MSEHHITLGVPEDATPEQIVVAYRKLAQKFHPDKHRGGPAMFNAITHARDALLAAYKEKGLFDDLFEQFRREA